MKFSTLEFELGSCAEQQIKLVSSTEAQQSLAQCVVVAH